MVGFFTDGSDGKNDDFAAGELLADVDYTTHMG